MTPEKFELLKKVLSVPTKTYKEGLMVEFITNWLSEKGIPHYVDEHLNVYATKQSDQNVEWFPCVISHTDTVHNLDEINVKEEYLPNAQEDIKLALKAYNNHGKPTGIGGDDKAGVFACLTLLEELPDLKAAFFVSEETGCHGSKNADPEFFKNVGYGIQFDAPENWMVTEYCFGQQLFERDSKFFEVCDHVLTEGTGGKQQYLIHPYTDVYSLRGLFDFQCINFSIGYYNYHTANEYVVVEDVENGIEMGRKMIASLGCNLHYKEKGIPKYKRYVF